MTKHNIHKDSHTSDYKKAMTDKLCFIISHFSLLFSVAQKQVRLLCYLPQREQQRMINKRKKCVLHEKQVPSLYFST